MGWESRKGRRYYYRTEWCGGMRRNVYYGAGSKGHQAARDDERQKQARAETISQLARARYLLGTCSSGNDALLAAQLAQAGWRRQYREWKEPPWQA